MHKVLLFISSILLYTSSWGHEWKKTEGELKFSTRNIEFSNRAHCAKQSLMPTKSIYMLIDNVNIGKSLYRLAKRSEKDPKEFINYGLQVYRSGLSRISQIIASGLLVGDLAYVDALNYNEGTLANNWRNYKNKKGNSLVCSTVKKLSVLQKSLSSSKPDTVLLEDLAKEQEDLDSYFSSCENTLNENLEVDLLLFEIDKKSTFVNDGFKFWQSFKIYLSWAFRNAPEVSALFYPFDFLFQSLHFEEMILIFSASCESITPPECSNNELSLEKIRLLTSPDDRKLLAELENTKLEDYASSHFSPPLPLKEDDLLNLLKAETSEAWVRNFRNGLISSRGYLKIKFKSAINKLKLISKALNSDQILRKINSETTLNSPDVRQELYYLCTEYNIAFSKDFGLLKNSLNQLYLSDGFGPVFEQFDAPSIHDMKDLTEKLPTQILNFCHDLQKRNFWTREDSFNQEGFSFWYQRFMDKEKNLNELKTSLWHRKVEKPFLALNDEFAICSTGPHCAREVLDSLIVLSRLMEDFGALLPKKQINSTNMTNPYAARMACGIYDPWDKQHQIIKNFLGDLLTASVMSVTPVPIYISAKIDPKKITAFNTLIKDDKIFYAPTFEKRKFHLSLLADLGPLISLPCAISITGSRINPFEYYMFKGISLTQCWERSKNDLIVESIDELDKKDRYNQGCIGCAINLETIASSASMINPLFRGSYFLLKGIVKLASEFKKPQDLARDWIVSPQQVALSYRYHGEISKKCARKLIRGKSCLPQCGSDLMEQFTIKYKGTPIYSDFNCFTSKGRIYIKECDEPIDLAKRGVLKLSTSCSLKER